MAGASRWHTRRVRPEPSSPRPGESGAPAATPCADPADSETSTPSPPRPALLAGAQPAVARLAAAPGRRPAGHRAPLAPPGLALGPVVALRAARWPTTALAGGP